MTEPGLRLYTWDTPNGEKIHIAIAELGLAVDVIAVDLGRGEQRSEGFLRLQPSGQIPVLIDRRGPDEMIVRDSSAILLHLYGDELDALPAVERADSVAWVMYAATALAPVTGLFHEFMSADATAVPAVLRRLQQRLARAYQVVDRALGDRPYLGGGFGVADVACYPWMREPERVGVDRRSLPGLSAWLDRMQARPAVAAGIARLESLRSPR